ncbi:hypothetical protein AVEN_66124-1 [Araneus ventricosus]|uniref:Tc1-like transposase DDE domain-containing protein n=1 Tax=Araneus ventricosus TaxID=182803 RepID=A0A4Y2HHW0_ARAVE|nr:hypothetical protein AVEN_66124-1 [Araneus ventricosus]
MDDHRHPFMLYYHPHGNGVFQQDNCTSRRSRSAIAWLDEHSSYLSVMNLPSRNPDLNHIAHLWDVLEKGVKAYHATPVILTELWTALADVWQAIPVESFRKLVSIPHRVAVVIKARGGPTHF